MAFLSIDLSQFSFEQIQEFSGLNDCNLEILSNDFHSKCNIRNNVFYYEDCEHNKEIQDVVQICFDVLDKKKQLNEQDIKYFIKLALNHKLHLFNINQLDAIGKTKSGRLIYPKTLGQARLCYALKNNDIVFATGAAGTGKTYLSVCYAVTQLKNKSIEKIVLTRPAVEAGESLGFLPGDMKEKVDPYLRPLYDALYDMLGSETVERYIEKQIIEIAPLAFMRGRTLNDAVVILDEAQNTTQAQMKMFLTRMGKNAKLIINGDITQIDLIRKNESGLIQACDILKDIDGIEMVHLGTQDVVRNPLVQKIIERYSMIEK